MPRLPLETMSLEEKLVLMDGLWADLRSRSDALPSPPWHGEVLAEREAALERGEITYEDFDVAKARILKEIERNRDR